MAHAIRKASTKGWWPPTVQLASGDQPWCRPGPAHGPQTRALSFWSKACSLSDPCALCSARRPAYFALRAPCSNAPFSHAPCRRAVEHGLLHDL